MNRIKQLREEFHFSQNDLAQRLGGAISSVAMYEKGDRKPSMEVLIKLSRIFNCSIDYILGLSDKRRVDNNHSNNIETIKQRFRILCLECEIEINKSKDDIVKELGFSPYEWSSSNSPTERQITQLCEYFCVPKSYLTGEEFLPNGDLSQPFNDFRGDIRFPYYKDMENMTDEQIKQIIIKFKNTFSDNGNLQQDSQYTSPKNSDISEPDIDVAFYDGYKGLNDQNKEIAKNIIAGLKAKQESEDKKEDKKD